jgi:hypothetical protein
MAHYYDARGNWRRRRHSPLFGPVVAFAAAGLLAAAYVAYVLWPRWPGTPVALESPALPIVIGGTMFNIEPAAIRRPVQRKPGTQDRVDLNYLWPSLTPPDPAAKTDDGKPADPNERLFLTIADGRDALPPIERIKAIYPRYLDLDTQAGPGGLMLRAFRDGSPYRGEDLIFASDLSFAARCTRSGIGNSGMCLFELRIGGADVIARFPRDWLDSKGDVEGGLARLIARLHPQ